MRASVVDGQRFGLYVLVGTDTRHAEAWMRARRIGQGQVVRIDGPSSLVRLRKLDSGAGVAVVWFPVPPTDGAVRPALLGRLKSLGAVDLPSSWWPVDMLPGGGR